MEEIFGEDVYFRRTGNVSEGGAYFDRAIPHALGTIVTLKFLLPGDKEMVIARGEVISSTGNHVGPDTDPGDGLGMRIRFLSIEGNGQRRLRTYIHGL